MNQSGCSFLQDRLNIQRIENTFLTSNTFVLSKDNECILIDCGDVEKIDDNLLVRAVLITHPHFDHIYGLTKLIEKCPECKIYILQGGTKYLESDKLNLSKYHETPYSFVSCFVIEVADGDTLDLLDNVQVKVYTTPGHNPTCATYLIGKYLFTGDSYIPRVKTVTNLPKANKQQALESELLIKGLWTEGVLLCPGHGEMVKR